jgi:hypothetical protein
VSAPSNLSLVSGLTIVKAIRRIFALMMPDKEPYYFAINVARNRDMYSHGWVQLRAASSIERRGTQLRKLSLHMSIGDNISTQTHHIPDTPYEGGVFLLSMDIDMPNYGYYLVEVKLEMEFPTEATIVELKTGETAGHCPIHSTETKALSSESRLLHRLLLSDRG